MTQIQFMLFFNIFPILCGLVSGIILWKLKKTYLLAGVMLSACAVWRCVLSNINLHGNEGPGLIWWMFTQAVLSFLAVELIKILIRK